MKKFRLLLRILVSHHTLPSVTSSKTILFENILSVLKTKTSVEVIWLVYMPDRLDLPQQNESDIKILDIHDYKNAVEVIQKVKPDVIYGSATPNLPDYALTLAGRFLNIPVIGEIMNQSLFKTSVLETVKSHVGGFFSSSVPTDTNEEKRFMKRGRFFIYKYFFVLRTQIAVKMNILKIIKTFLILVRSSFFIMKKLYDSNFSCDLNFAESETIIEPLIKEGFKKSTLVVTGLPLYDDLFDRLQKLQPSSKKDNKLQILLLTHSLAEHGFITKSQRDSMVKQIVSEICKYKDEMSLTVKIHPSSENLAEYQSLISTIDSTIPIHKYGDMLNFIEESDIVISYSTSSGPMQAFILKKPIIFCNFFGLEGDAMLKRGIVYDCKRIDSLIPAIKQLKTNNPITKQKIDDFIRDFFYKLDGKSSERVSEAILELLKNKSHNMTYTNRHD